MLGIELIFFKKRHSYFAYQNEKICLNLQGLDKNSFVSVWVTVGLSFTVMLYILFVLCDSWICCALLNNIYSQTSICCECPQRFFCILTSILKAKIVNIQRQTLLECRKELFIWMFEGQNIWNAQKNSKIKLQTMLLRNS